MGGSSGNWARRSSGRTAAVSHASGRPAWRRGLRRVNARRGTEGAPPLFGELVQIDRPGDFGATRGFRARPVRTRFLEPACWKLETQLADGAIAKLINALFAYAHHRSDLRTVPICEKQAEDLAKLWPQSLGQRLQFPARQFRLRVRWLSETLDDPISQVDEGRMVFRCGGEVRAGQCRRAAHPVLHSPMCAYRSERTKGEPARWIERPGGLYHTDPSLLPGVLVKSGRSQPRRCVYGGGDARFVFEVVHQAALRRFGRWPLITCRRAPPQLSATARKIGARLRFKRLSVHTPEGLSFASCLWL